MNVNIIVVSQVLSELVAGFQSMGVLNSDGTFNVFTPEQDAQAAALAVTILEKHGVNVPDKLENIVKALPLLIALVK